jgi:uncharacterized repeat protein (TIGR03803 family)
MATGTTLSSPENESQKLYRLFLVRPLASFGGNGNQPNSVILNAHGNVYGTTYLGGIDNLGTIFEVDAATHTLTTLATFDGANGANPSGGLFIGTDGSLYGTTVHGGSGYSTDFSGQGTVFKYDATSRTLVTLASLNDESGGQPEGGVVMGRDGNLYGTTTFQASTDDGTVFRLDSMTGSISTIVSFTGPNGSLPADDLVTDSDGNIYGTTKYGGLDNDGTIFELSVPEPQSLLFLAPAASICLLRRRSVAGAQRAPRSMPRPNRFASRPKPHGVPCADAAGPPGRALGPPR